MILAAFKENEPHSLDDYPFNDMYVTDKKFIKIGINDDIWLGILIGDTSGLTTYEIGEIGEYKDFQTNSPVTKAGIISRIYSSDEEAKILRDAAAGRNLDKFTEYDTFIESI